MGDEISGEICENCLPILTDLRDRLRGQEEINRRAAGALGKARRENPAERAREHHQWDRGVRLFRAWQRATGHARSRFTADRFLTALPFLEAYEDEMILRAIEGIAYDPFVTRRRNGTEQKHDGWDLLFRSTDKFEEFCNRAPLNWRDNLLEHAEEVAAR